MHTRADGAHYESLAGPGVWAINGNIDHSVAVVTSGVRFSAVTYLKNTWRQFGLEEVTLVSRLGFALPPRADVMLVPSLGARARIPVQAAWPTNGETACELPSDLPRRRLRRVTGKRRVGPAQAPWPQGGTAGRPLVHYEADSASLMRRGLLIKPMYLTRFGSGRKTAELRRYPAPKGLRVGDLVHLVQTQTPTPGYQKVWFEAVFLEDVVLASNQEGFTHSAEHGLSRREYKEFAAKQAGKSLHLWRFGDINQLPVAMMVPYSHEQIWILNKPLTPYDNFGL